MNKIIIPLLILLAFSFIQAKKSTLRKHFKVEFEFVKQIEELRTLPDFQCDSRHGDEKFACLG